MKQDYHSFVTLMPSQCVIAFISISTTPNVGPTFLGMNYSCFEGQSRNL